MRYDIAIVGTGPAGGSAANALAETGLNVLVLEKARLPRHKPCGGLMPHSVQMYLDCDISHLVEHRVEKILNLNDFADPRPQQIGHPAWLVNRARFDAGLIRAAIQRSEGRVSLREDFRVDNVVESAEDVLLQDRDGNSVSAKYVVGADGISSKTARCLGLNPDRQTAATIDAEILVEPEWHAREADRLTFNFSCLPAGYGWIFPKRQPLLSCGVGSWNSNARLRHHFERFIERSIPRDRILEIKEFGYPIPIWSGPTRLHTNRVCLAGDAASLVDPVSGEGIRFAIMSGRLAAETIVSAFDTRDRRTGLDDYTRKIHLALQPRFDFKRKFLFLAFTQAPDFFYEQAIKKAAGYAEEAGATMFH